MQEQKDTDENVMFDMIPVGATQEILFWLDKTSICHVHSLRLLYWIVLQKLNSMN